MKKKAFEQLVVGTRVYYTGDTNYSYHWGSIETRNYRKEGNKVINRIAKREPATVIQNTGHCVYLKLDNYRHPYMTKSTIPECDGIWVIPQEQFACVSIGDYVSGMKKIEVM